MVLSKDKKKAKEGDTAKALPAIISYQSWYSRSLPVVKQLIPERYQEFQEQYKLEKRKGKEISFLTYTISDYISDYLIGLRITRGWEKEEVVNPLSAFTSKFQHQIAILMSAQGRIDSILADVQGILQAELFDNELQAAQELRKKGHLRAAGALAGVTLESHLSKISTNHGLKLRKKDPTISDFNDELKNKDILRCPQLAIYSEIRRY